MIENVFSFNPEYETTSYNTTTKYNEKKKIIIKELKIY